ncbi:hypothetical protein [Deinococcus sp. Leaf326]|uniref:hypothetical protein n=1 Tax=Deinococcus sp. Leaf326 TaxID=1736338 RepID=UPI0006FBC0BB|nr:hypothetical protein [Deinococcus sp. Leaf326]KQR02005.1 hypothetical protein ASF71_21520 [Deinococcus sp. Leaf326]
MTQPPTPLTFWQARVLLLLTLEPQSVDEVSSRMAERGAVLNNSRVRQLLDELLAAGLVTQVPRKGHAGTRYGLGVVPAVDTALDQAYEIVASQSS